VGVGSRGVKSAMLGAEESGWRVVEDDDEVSEGAGGGGLSFEDCEDDEAPMR
jgi:hypothetical protein